MRKQTRRLAATADGITTAATLLAQGALVSFATETVYGLGADARNGTAVADIYAAKGRPSFNPLIMHLAEARVAENYAIWSETAARLSTAFWPGPLTLVLPLKADSGLSSLATAGLSTVALRVPAHPSARRLLAEFGGPVAAPSANRSGQISPTTADHVLAGLSGRISAVLDDGPSPVGLESTIVGLAGADPTLLRPGGVAAEDIERVLGRKLLTPVAGEVSAPGQLQSHYAPRRTVRLNAVVPQASEVMLGFGSQDGTLNLSPMGDLREAASRLFDHLHQLDQMDAPIAVAPIPDTGLGRAINDRLARAAAPRTTQDS